MSQTKQLYTKINTRLADKVKVEAKARHITQRELVEQALMDYLCITPHQLYPKL